MVIIWRLVRHKAVRARNFGVPACHLEQELKLLLIPVSHEECLLQKDPTISDIKKGDTATKQTHEKTNEQKKKKKKREKRIN